MGTMGLGRRLALLLLLAAAISSARTRELDFALILEEPAIAAKTSSRAMAHAAAAEGGLARIQAAQRAVTAELARRKVRVTGSAGWLLNAVFVRATRQQAAALRGMPGVSRVVYLPPIHMNLGAAAELANAPAAWNAAGGVENAGAGVKVAVIDSGIDHTHPAFQDPALQPPAGFPRGETGYTNGKIIVARSWVDELPFAEVFAIDSRPDDVTPRDRQGHGTAIAAIAAGVRHESPMGVISGIAPKAWIGNYKVFGSPGINDTTTAPVLIQALEAAFTDGMDIATLAIGDPASYGPLDFDPDPLSCGGPCDVRAQAVENAINNGMTVVVSAGNDGASGQRFPTLGTINTPGTAPSAITVGVSTNSHRFFSRVRASGQEFAALFGDGPRPAAPVSAPLRDVEGEACGALPLGSLTGTFAIIDRGACAFIDKVLNAQDAGAAGVIIVNVFSGNPIVPLGLVSTSIPTAMVGSGAGATLKSLAQDGTEAILDAALYASPDTANVVADFSSRGPALGENDIKPELVAPGTGIYTATQSLDPNSELYSPTRYTAVSSASFAVPMAAGAAALVKQRYPGPGFTPAHVKSALVNTAGAVADEAGAARVASAGAGLLDVAAARAANLTAEPATLAFGNVRGGLPSTDRNLRVTNHGAGPAAVSVAVVPRDQSSAQVTVNPANLNLGPGESGNITVSLTGNTPTAGSYEGFVTLQGGGTTLRVPYLFVAGGVRAADIYPIIGGEFVGVPLDTDWLIAFRLVDENGVAVAGVPVQWQSNDGDITARDSHTDILGVAAAWINLGLAPGEQVFSATAGGHTVEFYAFARPLPLIAQGGVLNAASGTLGQGLAPGSYASIYGINLADAPKFLTTHSLPLALGNVSVSFDVPDENAEETEFGKPSILSVPGRLSFAGYSQVNVQIPWELQGRSNAFVKVNVEGIPSPVYESLVLHPYSPALFEYADPATGQQFGAVQNENYELVSPSNPARPGTLIQIYANGLGPVDPEPASGEPAPLDSLVWTRQTPMVTIGGRPATVQFHGLTPGSIGLYQVNVSVPGDVPAGNQPVVITIGGVSSKPVNIPVQ